MSEVTKCPTCGEKHVTGGAEVTQLYNCTWRTIEALNSIVECDEASFEERHLAIEHVKKHLEARAEQCKPRDGIAFEDLLGGFTQ